MSDQPVNKIKRALSDVGIDIANLRNIEFPTHRQGTPKGIPSWAEYLVSLLERGDDILAAEGKEWEFRSIAEQIESRFFSNSPYWVAVVEKESKPGDQLGSLLSALLDKAAEFFALDVGKVVLNIQEGLPVYVKNESGEFTHPPQDNEDWLLLQLMTKQYGPFFKDSVYYLPHWACNLYVKASDYKAHKLFYGNDYWEVEGAVKVRRTALGVYLAGKLEGLSDDQGQPALEPRQVLRFPKPRGLPRSNDDHFTRRERDNMLRIIGVLAHEAYGNEKPTPAAEEILKHAATMNVELNITDETIANKLKEASELLGNSK